MPSSVLPNLETRASSEKKKTRVAANTKISAYLERRGNWEQVEEGRAHALYEAWWGKEITERTISVSDDLDNDAGDVSDNLASGAGDVPEGSDNDASDVVSIPPVGTIVNIDHTIGGKKTIGEILLRQEFVTTLAFIESVASRRPESGVIVTGQPGIGEHQC